MFPLLLLLLLLLLLMPPPPNATAPREMAAGGKGPLFPRGFRGLSGYQRITLAAQAKPAPKATRRTLSPRLRTPLRAASSRAMAIAAPLVLP